MVALTLENDLSPISANWTRPASEHREILSCPEWPVTTHTTLLQSHPTIQQHAHSKLGGRSAEVLWRSTGWLASKGLEHKYSFCQECCNLPSGVTHTLLTARRSRESAQPVLAPEGSVEKESRHTWEGDGNNEETEDHPTHDSFVIRGYVRNNRSMHEIQLQAKQALTCV